ncbi:MULTISPECIES: glutaredoxin family protein [unclassified Clostridium]|uniref:glutaredoxin family protein n=1 Tax=unclassified Clostridium TaxID=2614128 RepID=UPI001C8C9AF0|nr:MULTISPECIES: glutaredoxin family protein [unclassified Clostridium]MBX9136471.1 glutaredoxin family protein [Clostridium sp. K12(2020)]MBX9143048.1 glutaredoxin family protein [Clostridium sp. K13]
MIKVYSTESCPWCVKAKQYLKSKNIEYIEVNVGEDMEGREEMIKLSGQMGVPVINIDGKIIVGFDKMAIDEAINTK